MSGPPSTTSPRARQIEALSAQGLSAPKIAKQLGCSETYAQEVIVSFRGVAGRDETMPSYERDARHVADCIAAGGFMACTFKPRPLLRIAS